MLTYNVSPREIAIPTIKSCFLFPWYIYKSFRLLYELSVPSKSVVKLVKAYLFFPYFVLKIYRTLLLRYNFALENSKKETNRVLTIGKNDFYDEFVSIIIPVYNGGDDIKKLIPILKKQEKIKNIEIIAIDSGSTDGTKDFLLNENVKVMEIPKSQFSHSGTRNLGAKAALGNILLFMTQDAIPEGTDWVFRLITPIVEYNTAASTCIEIPRPDCSVFSGVEIDNYKMIDTIGDRIVRLISDKCPPEWWRENAKLYDVACAVKKEIFDTFQYRGDFGEDVDLSVRLLQAGYAISVLSSIQIIHSHERTGSYYFARSYLDTKTLSNIIPDFQIRSRSLKNIIKSALYTYIILNILFKHIESLNDNYEPDMFINNCMYYWREISKNKLRKENFGSVSSNSDIDNFFGLLINYFSFIKFKNMYYFDDLMYFLNFSVLNYLNIHYKQIDHYLKRMIIEALLKKFLMLLGNDFALYFCKHPQESNPIYIKLEEMSKGI